MLVLILEIIVFALICFIIDLFTYKYIRYLDKKERKKLAEKETEYLKSLINEMNEETKEKEESEIDLFDF